jgi:NAD(P)-dependent dehydrogenase (short-subunit alcohol dehydrogenase family)
LEKMMANERTAAHRVALVTGGARGLGAATCEVLSRDGFAVVVADVRGDAARSTAARVSEAGGEAVAVDLDVTDDSSAGGAVAHALACFGRLDVLINNAGVDVTKAVDELELEEWDRVLDVNLRGAYLMARHALPPMKAAGQGHIVNIVSTAARRAWPNASAYHASKWGLLGFSHALHAEARQYGVKVTAVISGGMKTDFLFERFPEIDAETLQSPHNVAEAIRFVLNQPEGSVIPELMVLPMRETSWP